MEIHRNTEVLKDLDFYDDNNSSLWHTLVLACIVKCYKKSNSESMLKYFKKLCLCADLILQFHLIDAPPSLLSAHHFHPMKFWVNSRPISDVNRQDLDCLPGPSNGYPSEWYPWANLIMMSACPSMTSRNVRCVTSLQTPNALRMACWISRMSRSGL